jgi:4-amino-4-deoxy-L-arabinose transferase-like glycosyltransferase
LSQPQRNILVALAAVVASTWISPFQRGLFIGDETKYAQVIREMRATGAFFLPTLNGAPFTHKPPLHFWLIDLLTIPLGLYSMWAFVLPSLLAFVFLLWLMRRMGGPLAAFVCGTSLMVWGSAQTARMDVSFTACIALGAWMLQRFFESEDRRALLYAGVALGVATLIKGPMAPVIGVILFLLEAWRRRRLGGAPAPLPAYIGAVAAMALIPLLWFVPAMILGGDAFTREVVMKQTVGRAVAAWVHNAPPWFYLLHMPGILFPWFFLAVAALRGANRFYLSWIAAVLLPYSVMSSKLDVYMMAMIPPVALMIADYVRAERGKLANAIMLAVLAILGLTGAVTPPARLKSPDAALLSLPTVKAFFILLALSAVVGLIATYRSAFFSALAVGIAPLIAFSYASLALMPLANDIATPQRLIAALQRQRVAPEQIALYSCPYLWSRNFPRELERVRYIGAENVGTAVVIATSRKHASEIEAALRNYRLVDGVRMIGKWFDVYRR